MNFESGNYFDVYFSVHECEEQQGLISLIVSKRKYKLQVDAEKCTLESTREKTKRKKMFKSVSKYSVKNPVQKLIQVGNATH